MLSHHLEKLRHFSGVVKSGSIRSYANQNRLSQPAISKCIQLLEEALEASLLIRSREGIELTPQGQIVFDFSETILAASRRVENSIRNEGNVKLSGSLSMGTYQSIAVYFLPKFLKFIARSQEKLKLHLVNASSADLVKAVRSGKVDFIVSIDPPSSADLFQIEIYTDFYSLYRKVGTTHSLNLAPVFTLPTATDREGKTLEMYLREAKFCENIFSCGDFESVKAMVEEDVGFAFMPDRVAAPLIQSGSLEKVREMRKLDAVGEHSVVFSCRKHRAADQAIRWMSRQLVMMMRSAK